MVAKHAAGAIAYGEFASGQLIAVRPEDIRPPFPVKRVYVIFGTGPDVTRGKHAHRDLWQLAVAMTGACTFILDDGHERSRIRLDSPDKGLLIGPGTWREMRDFSADCVLAVFASNVYDPTDYIHEFEELLKFRGKT